MSSDPDDRSDADTPAGQDASADMEAKLEQLDDHIEDAQKKADAGRPPEQPDAEDPVDDVAGGGSDHDEHVDDPEGPLVGPE